MWKIHNIVFNGERLKAFHLRSGRRWGYLLFTTYIQHSAGRSIRGIRQGKEKASKLEISKFICRWYDVTCRKLKTPQKVVATNKVAEYKVNTPKSVSSLYNEQTEKEITKTILYTISIKKNKILSN